jgi:hypothetical protein
LLGSDSIPERLRQSASVNAAICARSDGERFAVAYRYAGRIEIRTAINDSVQLAAVPMPSNGDFLLNSSGEWVLESQRAFYEDCAATDQHVFALFSGWNAGNPSETRDVRESNLSNAIHVFDWSGSLVGIVELDQRVSSIFIDESAGSIYGTGTDRATVFRFAMPDAFRYDRR